MRLKRSMSISATVSGSPLGVARRHERVDARVEPAAVEERRERILLRHFGQRLRLAGERRVIGGERLRALAVLRRAPVRVLEVEPQLRRHCRVLARAGELGFAHGMEFLVQRERRLVVAGVLEHLRQRLAGFGQHAATRRSGARARSLRRTTAARRRPCPARAATSRAPSSLPPARAARSAAWPSSIVSSRICIGLGVAVQQAQHGARLPQAVRFVVRIAELARELEGARALREPLRIFLLRRRFARLRELVAALLGEERLGVQELGQQVAIVRRLRELEAGAQVAWPLRRGDWRRSARSRASCGC